MSVSLAEKSLYGTNKITLNFKTIII